nr:hypothetical protein [Aeromicrobium sp.]
MYTRLPCREMFGQARGVEIQELVEKVTGADCPCIQGKVCPLLSTQVGGLALPEQREAAPAFL